VADARNAQLKHVRKTDGKNDPSLDTAEASANKVLAGGRCCLLSCVAGSAATLPSCSCMRLWRHASSSGVQSAGCGECAGRQAPGHPQLRQACRRPTTTCSPSTLCFHTAARREAYLSHEEEVHAELVALAADAQVRLQCFMWLQRTSLMCSMCMVIEVLFDP
jgi:hypothetical protein